MSETIAVRKSTGKKIGIVLISLVCIALASTYGYTLYHNTAVQNESLTKQLQVQLSEIASLNQTITNLQASINQKDSQTAQLANQTQSLNSQLVSNKIEIQNLENQIQNLYQQIAKYQPTPTPPQIIYTGNV